MSWNFNHLCRKKVQPAWQWDKFQLLPLQYYTRLLEDAKQCQKEKVYVQFIHPFRYYKENSIDWDLVGEFSAPFKQSSVFLILPQGKSSWGRGPWICLAAQTSKDRLSKDWLHREKLARLKIELASHHKVQQAVQPPMDLANDKAARGEGVEKANVPKQGEKALEQQRKNDETAVARLMEIRCQKLRRAFETEQGRQKETETWVIVLFNC